jgi:hypothetical protein
MMIPDWIRGKTTPEATGLKLGTVVDIVMFAKSLAMPVIPASALTSMADSAGNKLQPT